MYVGHVYYMTSVCKCLEVLGTDGSETLYDLYMIVLGVFLWVDPNWNHLSSTRCLNQSIRGTNESLSKVDSSDPLSHNEPSDLGKNIGCLSVCSNAST